MIIFEMPGHPGFVERVGHHIARLRPGIETTENHQIIHVNAVNNSNNNYLKIHTNTI